MNKKIIQQICLSFRSYCHLHLRYRGAGTDAEGFHQDGKRAYEAGNDRD